jgi:hypothetical protein
MATDKHVDDWSDEEAIDAVAEAGIGNLECENVMDWSDIDEDDMMKADGWDETGEGDVNEKINPEDILDNGYHDLSISISIPVLSSNSGAHVLILLIENYPLL